MLSGRWEGYGALLMWEAQKLVSRLTWTLEKPQNLGLALSLGTRIRFLFAWNSAAGLYHMLDRGTCSGVWGHHEWGCKDPRFSWSPCGGALCSLLQDLRTRPCHHNSPLQMRKLSTKWKQVNCNAHCLLSLPWQPACQDGETQPGVEALPFHCVPGAFPCRAHELPQVAWQRVWTASSRCQNRRAWL